MAQSKIRRIPTADNVSAPVSLRPSGSNPGIDVDAPFEGGRALAAGVDQLGQGLQAGAESVLAKERVSQVAAADAAWLKGSLDIGNRYQNDPDFSTFDKRVQQDTGTLRDEAAKLIRDPEAKQAWIAAVEQKRITLHDAVNDYGRELSQDADRTALSTSIDDLAKVYADPSTPMVTRDQARRQIETSIRIAERSGLIRASEAAKLRVAGLEQADEALAWNRVRLDVITNPQAVLNGVAIPAPTDVGGGALTSAISAANGGALPQFDYALAKITAESINDANFPTDPKQAAAYLSDPEKAAEYTAAATAMLQDRYKGDLSAVVIALDPKGGTVLADAWVRSGHDEDKLPPEVRARFRKTMQAYAPAVSGERIAIEAEPGVDLNNSDPAVLDRYEQLQTNFGRALPLISAARDSEHNKAVGGADNSQHLDGRALDIDVSSLSTEERVQFLQMASAMGFTGLGVYKNSVHLDTGEVRAWGPDHSSESVPAWAKPTTDAHISGTAPDVPLVYQPVDPRYAALSFDQRLRIASEARTALKEQGINMQASLETIGQNAPVAIANTGTYDGALPDANAFVKAYGAEEGIQRYRSFEASVDAARITFGFRMQSTDEIMAQVGAAAPKSSGNEAYLETKRFELISAAAETTIKARNADPAGYVFNIFPDVAKAFEAAEDDPGKFTEALSKMEAAQAELGIDRPQLLPKQMAANAVAQFNDITLNASERVGAVAGLVLRTDNENQQKAILDQLLGAGLPPHLQGAIAAFARNDQLGSFNLMRAALVDPDKLAGELPAGITSTQVNGAIQDRIFDEGQIGDVLYGVTSGSADNFARMEADTALINRGVRLHLIDGSAGGDVNRAVDLTIRDMYGDTRVAVGQGYKIALPADADPQTYDRGFSQLLPQVREALATDMRDGLLDILGDQVDIRSSGMSEITRMGVENALNQVMSEGYFVNAGKDQFQFFNPFTGTVIGDGTGKPLLFGNSDVIAASTNAPPPSDAAPSDWAWNLSGLM